MRMHERLSPWQQQPGICTVPSGTWINMRHISANRRIPPPVYFYITRPEEGGKKCKWQGNWMQGKSETLLLVMVNKATRPSVKLILRFLVITWGYRSILLLNASNTLFIQCQERKVRIIVYWGFNEWDFWIIADLLCRSKLLISSSLFCRLLL